MLTGGGLGGRLWGVGDNFDKKLVIGILGGIGSGKSCVAGEFEKLGCGVIDADKIGHELLERDEVKGEIVGCFGESVLGADGRINRRILGEIVFSDGDKLGKLNSIMHWRIIGCVEGVIEDYKRQDDIKAIVLDGPLLVEVGLDKYCDKLIFVECDAAIRAERVARKDCFDEKQLKMRENFQISLDSKAGLADNAVVNNSDLSDLVEQVGKIFSQFSL